MRHFGQKMILVLGVFITLLVVDGAAGEVDGVDLDGGKVVDEDWVLPSVEEIKAGIKGSRDRLTDLSMTFVIMHSAGAYGEEYGRRVEGTYRERMHEGIRFIDVHEVKVDEETGEVMGLIRSEKVSDNGHWSRVVTRDIDRVVVDGILSSGTGDADGHYLPGEVLWPLIRLWGYAHYTSMMEDRLFESTGPSGFTVKIEDGGEMLGVRTVKVVQVYKGSKTSHWFAPTRSWLRLRKRGESTKGLLDDAYTDHKLEAIKQLENGMWYPVRIANSCARKDGGEYLYAFTSNIVIREVSSERIDDGVFLFDPLEGLKAKRDALMGRVKGFLMWGGLIGGGFGIWVFWRLRGRQGREAVGCE